MHAIDLYVQNYFLTARTPVMTEIMNLLTSIFNVTNPVSFIRFIVIVSCVAVLIYWTRNKKYVVLFLLSLLGGAILAEILKYIFDVARPLGALIIVPGQSFPSYHATISTVFFTMLMYVFDSHFKRFGRIIFNTLCVSGIILVSFSRVYLGVHWLSDVIGGIILGILVSYISIKIFKLFSK